MESNESRNLRDATFVIHIGRQSLCSRFYCGASYSSCAGHSRFSRSSSIPSFGCSFYRSGLSESRLAARWLSYGVS